MHWWNLLLSTWKSAQFCVAAWIEGKCGEGWTQVYSWPSPFTLYLKLPEYYYFFPLSLFFSFFTDLFTFFSLSSIFLQCRACYQLGGAGANQYSVSPWGGFPEFGAGA